MNDLKNQIEILRKTIFKIYENRPDGYSSNQEDSFKLFVKASLNCQLQLFIARYKRYGLSEAETVQCIVIRHQIFEITQKQIDDCDTNALTNALLQYVEIVTTNPPYTDVLSYLLESIMIAGKRENRLEQFLTPPWLAGFLAELMPMQNTDKPFIVGEFCCGAGTLLLAPLALMMSRNPHHAKNATVMANDIDPIMCCTTALQIITNTVVHDIDLCEFTQHCSNVITEWTEGNPYVIRFKTPAKVFEARAKIREEELRACGYYDIVDEPETIKPSSMIEARSAYPISESVGAV
ncbi:hypothetical protein AU074_13660 [Pseudomonas sp. ATCC PTA-122608]|uniref:hypothetical protein n=1 Tax=Pseudomonas sp. ATCC PTA-122608 TaxID=1771311 RepID=UPI00096B9354|nr:hypothetical protein [Pseudomonas sp. ATCC PTA-122608]OLY72216.1 hypothetical protein AU074_13660 [Pseudomonas sp. ATCC PTA-122608]